jgi:hypothetical protein
MQRHPRLELTGYKAIQEAARSAQMPISMPE